MGLLAIVLSMGLLAMVCKRFIERLDMYCRCRCNISNRCLYIYLDGFDSWILARDL